jgi:hypothetical protein
VEISPWHFEETSDLLLKVRTETQGVVCRFEHRFRPNDFESVFDSLMDRASRSIKAQIKQYEKEQENDG